MKKTYFAILGAAAILSLATACSSKNVNEPTANESSQSASSESSSNGMDESSPMDDLKEDAKDAVLPSEGTVHIDWYDQRHQRLYVYDHRRRNRL